MSYGVGAQGVSPKGTESAQKARWLPSSESIQNMPILAAEPDIFPADLLSRDDSPFGSGAQWWAVYTRSRQEKRLVRGLIDLKVPCYCPTVAHRYRSPAGRVRTSYLPLFANYLFIHGDEDQRHRALTTNLVAKTILVTNADELERDLRQIQRLIVSGNSIAVVDRLQPGARVRIKAGPLSGLEGVVIKREGDDYLFVAVNFLQQGALVKLDDYDVELAE